MDIKTLCLSALSVRDASGYELKKLMEESFSQFFAASFGSIYPALNKLTEDGYLAFVQETQEGRPAKKVYSITPLGLDHLKAELAKAPDLQTRIKSEFLATVCFAHLIDPERLQDIIDQQIKAYRDEVARIDAEDENCEDCPWEEGTAIHDAMHFVGNFGKAIYTTAYEYLEQNQDQLIEIAKRGKRAPTMTQPETPKE